MAATTSSSSSPPPIQAKEDDVLNFRDELSRSSYTSLPRVKRHDVFICLRNMDTRANFASHLCDTLSRKQIKCFIVEQDRHVRVKEMYRIIYTGIEESKLAVVIFSETFAYSEWCLDELVKIQECIKTYGQIVIPVYYNVDPADVLHQTGTYADAFDVHDEFVNEDDKENGRVQMWRNALTEIANIPGWVWCSDDRYVDPAHVRCLADAFDVHIEYDNENETVQNWRNALTEIVNLPGSVWPFYSRKSDIINGIVEDILKKLSNMTAYDSSRFVGIEKHILKIEELFLSDVCTIVGIWGIGGIGKTTIATGVYCTLRHRFEECYFVENVRENSNKRGLKDLRNELLSHILNKRIYVSTPDLPTFIREKLRHKTVLIVLDDVDDESQIESLVGRGDLFNFGSRIIVTTRDKGILKGVADNDIYEVKQMDWNEALELFSLKAFHLKSPKEDFTNLSNWIVHHATSVPLVLNLWGSVLYGRSKEEWEREFEKIKKHGTLFGMFDVLKLSFYTLNRAEKNLFLDIACFFKGENLDFVKRILSACRFLEDKNGIHNLMEKSMVTIRDNIIEVQASLQDMGQEIIRGQYLQEPGKHSRLWDPKQVEQILRCNTGTKAVQGIFLDMSKVEEIELSPEAFTRMRNLRLLKFYVPSYHNSSKICLPRGLEYLPHELRYLHWHGYPSKSLPFTFSPKKLVELHMPHSNVVELWKGIQHLPFLNKINLSYSKHLIGIPDLSDTQCLEIINLEFCTNLRQVDSSVQHLASLRHLNLKCCEKLKSLPSLVNLSSLEVLDLRRCLSLEMFPKIECSMKNLDSLVLDGCESLESLTSSIHMLTALTNISLDGCSKLEKLPEIFEGMITLRSLKLKATAVKELPLSISHLLGLKTLNLDMCTNLEFLPDISALKYLEILSLSCCEKFLKLPCLAGLSSLVEINLSACCNLLQIPEDIGCLSSLSNLSLKGSKIVSVPASIKNLPQLHHLDLTDCTMLKFLPELPLFLQYLYATNCISLEKVSSSKSELLSHNATGDMGNNFVQLFDFTDCLELDQESRNNIVEDAQIRIQHMAKLSRKLPASVTFCFPGNEIPDMFVHRTEGSCLTMKLSPGWCHDRFLGFALCIVAEFKGRALEDFSLQCGLKVNDGNIQMYSSRCLWYGTRFVDSQHTLLWYDHAFHNQTMKKMKNGYHTDEISFDFYSINGYDFVYSWEVMKCGLCLLYAQDADEEEERVGETEARGEEEKEEEERVGETEARGEEEKEEEERVAEKEAGEWKVPKRRNRRRRGRGGR
ncbi:Disease resistance protein (TIR-NBS-LRR class) family [Quillaja saponaria]|uniref:ADP-ribosyl cyclase/cyclic ADP-ribose hydrolase n=1 Tax=Quillaja saponaria TaxID=32244 RepID=A0AAD7L5A5_QUISA|nr:Disease resistance protein (TIR-NBS-LRR class) family [Quillaja saponaria]